MKIDKLLNENPYSLSRDQKKNLFSNKINELTRFHRIRCKEYKKIIDFFGFENKKNYELSNLPFLPVQIFKEFDLISTDKKNIVKILRSSGTSSSHTSKIFLDKKNSLEQVKALKTIVQYHIGTKRLPMLIIDKKSSIINSKDFDAKKAAFFGFSIFGKDFFYLIKENGEIDYKGLNIFLKESNKSFFIFGFTYPVYNILYNKLIKKNLKNNFSKGILIHGGGWKKMEKVSISNKKFKSDLRKKLNLKNIYNYYGLVEQTGSIFLECNCGYFLSTNFSEVLIRNENFELSKKSEKGFVQLISLLPSSYPGHNILTQDIGEIKDRKSCKCKLNGTRFVIHGRAKQAEVRGCSDTLNG
jgi:hypothetical protein